MSYSYATEPLELTVSRQVNAPRELVFRAWTEPAQLEKWWGPQGCETFDCRVDLRVGGEFCLNLRTPDGNVYPCQGTYREIVPPERLVYFGTPDEQHACGAGLPPKATVTVTFEALGHGTQVTVHTVFASPERRTAALEHGYQQGWTSCLEALAEYVTQ